MAAAQRFCSKCKKTMADTNFYQYKNGEKCELCKSCMTMHMNMYEEDTYLWALEMFDVPYIPVEWKKTREKEFEKAYNKAVTSGSKDPQTAAYNMTRGNSVVFGKYLSKMKIKQWAKYSWADNEMLQEKEKEDAKNFGADENQMNEKLKEMEEAYKRGEISEAQYMTWMDISSESIKPEKTLEEKFLAQEPDFKNITGDNPSPYPENDHPFEEVDLPDVSMELTMEDKRYLALKWGRLYSAEDWVSLEATYKDYYKSFDIHNADLEKGLIQLCKLDLKLNQAMDSGDFDSYAKLYRSYDALRKSLKFTEAQNKEDKAGEFDAVGAIVAFAEKEGGFIPEWEIEAPRDIIDVILEDNRKYIRTLWENDTHLAQQIEEFMEKIEIQRQQKEDAKKAKEMGLDEVPIEDEDYKEYYNQLEKQRNADLELIGEEEE